MVSLLCKDEILSLFSLTSSCNLEKSACNHEKTHHNVKWFKCLPFTDWTSCIRFFTRLCFNPARPLGLLLGLLLLGLFLLGLPPFSSLTMDAWVLVGLSTDSATLGVSYSIFNIKACCGIVGKINKHKMTYWLLFLWTVIFKIGFNVKRDWL